MNEKDIEAYLVQALVKEGAVVNAKDRYISINHQSKPNFYMRMLRENHGWMIQTSL